MSKNALYDHTTGGQFPHDNEEGRRSPEDFGIKYEDITVVTEDKVTLKGWLMHANPEKYPNEAERPFIVFTK